MKKYVRWALLMLLPVFMLACAKLYDGDDPTEDIALLPPGKIYTPEGKYNLNVVYYVPADVDTLARWHRRMSGITLHTQKFYKENMNRFMYEKTFGLVVNDNPEYIKVHYIKSKKNSSAMQEKDIAGMTEEIMTYFKENPTEQTSNHFLVYMPKYKGSFMGVGFRKSEGSTLTAPDLAFAFAGCDALKFDIKYFPSAKARSLNLASLGEVLYQLGRSFLLTNNNGKNAQATYSLMGTELIKFSNSYTTTYYHMRYKETPDKIRLTETDAMRLNQIQMFNEEHTYKDTRVTMEKVDLRYENDSLILVNMSFRSPDEIVAAIIYNDPWRSFRNNATRDTTIDQDPLVDSGGDAITYYVRDLKKEGDLYQASFVLPWDEMMSTSKYAFAERINAEIRFSFVGKGGIPYPHPGIGVKGTFDEKIRGTYLIYREAHEIISTDPYVFTPDFTNFEMGK